MDIAEDIGEGDLIFRPSLHVLLSLLAAVLGLGSVGLVQACIARAGWGWGLVLGALAMGWLLAARFANHVVILRDDEIVLHVGLLQLQEVRLPLQRVQIVVKPSWLGAWADYETVLFQADGTSVTFPRLGQARAMLKIAECRRRSLLESRCDIPSLLMPHARTAAESVPER